jgi:hypothetical protein
MQSATLALVRLLEPTGHPRHFVSRKAQDDASPIYPECYPRYLDGPGTEPDQRAGTQKESPRLTVIVENEIEHLTDFIAVNRNNGCAN